MSRTEVKGFLPSRRGLSLCPPAAGGNDPGKGWANTGSLAILSASLHWLAAKRNPTLRADTWVRPYGHDFGLKQCTPWSASSAGPDPRKRPMSRMETKGFLPSRRGLSLCPPAAGGNDPGKGWANTGSLSILSANSHWLAAKRNPTLRADTWVRPYGHDFGLKQWTAHPTAPAGQEQTPIAPRR